jgi:carbonic anhydrase/acetyltransferase-like protein (isoleucine patch superfamily)
MSFLYRLIYYCCKAVDCSNTPRTPSHAASATRTQARCFSDTCASRTGDATVLRERSKLATMSGLRTLVALLNQRVRPFVLPNAHVSPSASVIGNVAIADHVFIKPNAVLRGDSLVPDDLIRLGGYTVIGENTVLNAAVQIGSWCRVGAACSIGRAARIGNVVTLGDGTIVGAGAEIPHEVCTEPRTVIPDGAQLEPNARYAGNPATRVGEWSGFDVEESKKRAQAECALGAQHAYEFLPLE